MSSPQPVAQLPAPSTADAPGDIQLGNGAPAERAPASNSVFVSPAPPAVHKSDMDDSAVVEEGKDAPAMERAATATPATVTKRAREQQPQREQLQQERAQLQLSTEPTVAKRPKLSPHKIAAEAPPAPEFAAPPGPKMPLADNAAPVSVPVPSRSGPTIPASSQGAADATLQASAGAPAGAATAPPITTITSSSTASTTTPPTQRPRRFRCDVVYSPAFVATCDLNVMHKGRMGLWEQLVLAAGLLQLPHVKVVAPRLATEEELGEFHAEEYLAAVKDLDATHAAHESDPDKLDTPACRELQQRFGLGCVCIVFIQILSQR